MVSAARGLDFASERRGDVDRVLILSCGRNGALIAGLDGEAVGLLFHHICLCAVRHLLSTAGDATSTC